MPNDPEINEESSKSEHRMRMYSDDTEVINKRKRLNYWVESFFSFINFFKNRNDYEDDSENSFDGKGRRSRSPLIIRKPIDFHGEICMGKFFMGNIWLERRYNIISYNVLPYVLP